MSKNRFQFSDDFILNNGNVGINTAIPQEKLDVVSIIKGDDLKVTGLSSFTTYDGFLNSNQNITETTTISGDKVSGSLSGEIIVGTGVTATVAEEATSSQGNVDSLKVYNTFTVPTGGTEERPRKVKPGQLFFNRDFATMEFWDGDRWRQVDNTTQSGRGVFSSGDQISGPSAIPSISIEFVNIQSQGNSQYFGDTTQSRTNAYGCSDGKRGVFGGGYSTSVGGSVNTVDYITIASQGNAITFGTLSVTRNATASVSSSTRGLWSGGTLTPGGLSNTIDYVEIQTLGIALDFGDLATARNFTFGCGDTTRGIVAGGSTPGTTGSMEFFTISSKGNAINFGNLTQARRTAASCSNSVRGIFAGGGASPIFYNTIDYLTIASLGNAQDFGDASVQYENRCGVCDQTRALIGGGLNPGLSPTRINTIEFVTIATTGNAQDFGDLATQRRAAGGVSDSHGGLGGF
jgi:hypothetical protein